MEHEFEGKPQSLTELSLRTIAGNAFALTRQGDRITMQEIHPF
jgi:hypothetical protein